MVVLVAPKAPRAIEILIQDPRNTISTLVLFQSETSRSRDRDDLML